MTGGNLQAAQVLLRVFHDLGPSAFLELAQSLRSFRIEGPVVYWISEHAGDDPTALLSALRAPSPQLAAAVTDKIALHNLFHRDVTLEYPLLPVKLVTRNMKRIKSKTSPKSTEKDAFFNLPTVTLALLLFVIIAKLIV